MNEATANPRAPLVTSAGSVYAANADIVVDPEAPPPAGEARPKTGGVLGLLAAAALIFSYLISYCGVNALLAAEVIKPWKSGHDPRPRLFAVSLVIVMALFGAVGALARWISGRQLKTLDQMEDEKDLA